MLSVSIKRTGHVLHRSSTAPFELKPTTRDGLGTYTGQPLKNHQAVLYARSMEIEKTKTVGDDTNVK